MTNEELINELIRHKKEMQNDFGWNTTLQEALDASIAALKAQPCAEVIDKIKELIAEEIDNSRKRSWAAKQEYREGLAAAIGIIDAYLLRQQEGKK